MRAADPLQKRLARSNSQAPAARTLLEYSGAEGLNSAILISVSGCPACVTAATTLLQMTGILLLSIKIDREDKLALGVLMKAGVTSFPRVAVFRGVEKVLQFSGLPESDSPEVLVNQINSAFAGDGRVQDA